MTHFNPPTRLLRSGRAPGSRHAPMASRPAPRPASFAAPRPTAPQGASSEVCQHVEIPQTPAVIESSVVPAAPPSLAPSPAQALPPPPALRARPVTTAIPPASTARAAARPPVRPRVPEELPPVPPPVPEPEPVIEPAPIEEISLDLLDDDPPPPPPKPRPTREKTSRERRPAVRAAPRSRDADENSVWQDVVDADFAADLFAAPSRPAPRTSATPASPKGDDLALDELPVRSQDADLNFSTVLDEDGTPPTFTVSREVPRPRTTSSGTLLWYTALGAFCSGLGRYMAYGDSPPSRVLDLAASTTLASVLGACTALGIGLADEAQLRGGTRRIVYTTMSGAIVGTLGSFCLVAPIFGARVIFARLVTFSLGVAIVGSWVDRGPWQVISLLIAGLATGYLTSVGLLSRIIDPYSPTPWAMAIFFGLMGMSVGMARIMRSGPQPA
jgi:hypothetical protein